MVRLQRILNWFNHFILRRLGIVMMEEKLHKLLVKIAKEKEFDIGKPIYEAWDAGIPIQEPHIESQYERVDNRSLAEIWEEQLEKLKKEQDEKNNSTDSNN